MACGETKGIQRGDVVVDSKLRPSVRCVCVLWMVEYSVLVCNSLGVLKAGRVTSVWWRGRCATTHGREEKAAWRAEPP